MLCSSDPFLPPTSQVCLRPRLLMEALGHAAVGRLCHSNHGDVCHQLGEWVGSVWGGQETEEHAFVLVYGELETWPGPPRLLLAMVTELLFATP